MQPFSFEYLFVNPVLPSQRLEYEALDEKNYRIIGKMFKNETSKFADEIYTVKKELEEYFVFYQTHLKYRGKDWLVKTIDNKEYVGIFHLYDFSRETVNNRDKKCTIGFAVAPEYRRKYYAAEIITHLLNYIFTNLPMIRVLACSDIDNIPAAKLLESINFKFNPSDYFDSENTNHFEMFKSNFIKNYKK